MKDMVITLFLRFPVNMHSFIEHNVKTLKAFKGKGPSETLNQSSLTFHATTLWLARKLGIS